MKRKKLFIILPLAAIIVLVLAFGAIGTNAWFYDQETSKDNVLEAGTLDLKVDGQDDSNVAHITVDNMKPNDTVYQYWVLKNVGSIDGQPSIEFGVMTNNDNGLTEPESDVDSTGGDGEGELGANLYAMMKWRQNGGTWQAVRLKTGCGDPLLNGLSGMTVGEGLFNACVTDNALPVLGQNEEVEVQFRLWIMNSIGNIIQSDSSSFDVIFHLEQVH